MSKEWVLSCTQNHLLYRQYVLVWPKYTIGCGTKQKQTLHYAINTQWKEHFLYLRSCVLLFQSFLLLCFPLPVPVWLSTFHSRYPAPSSAPHCCDFLPSPDLFHPCVSNHLHPACIFNARMSCASLSFSKPSSNLVVFFLFCVSFVFWLSFISPWILFAL